MHLLMSGFYFIFTGSWAVTGDNLKLNYFYFWATNVKVFHFYTTYGPEGCSIFIIFQQHELQLFHFWAKWSFHFLFGCFIFSRKVWIFHRKVPFLSQNTSKTGQIRLFLPLFHWKSLIFRPILGFYGRSGIISGTLVKMNEFHVYKGFY